MFWEATCGARPANACQQCQKTSGSLFQKYGVDPIPLGRFSQPDEKTGIETFVRNQFENNIFTPEHKGFPIGEWIRSSVNSHLRVGKIDLTDKKHLAVYKAYLTGGIYVFNLLERAFQKLSPSRLVLFNGRMSYLRVALELAKSLGIPTTVHERGNSKESLVFFENEECGSISYFDMIWHECKQTPLSKEKIYSVKNWLDRRASGAGLNWEAFTSASSSEKLSGFLTRNSNRKLCAMFTSSTDEIAEQSFYFKAFRTQDEWITRSIEYFRGRKDLALIIRAHPNIGSKNSTGVNQKELEFIQSLRANIPENILLIEPEEDVFSYEVMRKADVGLVFLSTVCIEMACMGKPVLLASESGWKSAPLIFPISDAESYEKELEAFLARSFNPDELVARLAGCFRFVYNYAYKWTISFPLVKMPNAHSGILNASSSDDLRPGLHPELDYATEIVLGERTPIPQFDAYYDGKDTEEELAAIANLLYPGQKMELSFKKPKISVVITCYNYSRFLPGAVESVMKQTFQDTEIIIVNDGSADESLEVAKECAALYSQKSIKVVNQPNSGEPALARNAGIRVARGEFILPLDADDRIAPEYLEQCMAAAEKSPGACVFYSNTVAVEKESAKIVTAPGLVTLRMESKRNYFVYCCCYRRSVWEELGGYRAGIRGYEDWDFWIAVLLKHTPFQKVNCLGLIYNQKEQGAFADARGRHGHLFSRLILNNSGAYSVLEINQARSVLGLPVLAADVSKPFANSTDLKILELCELEKEKKFPKWDSQTMANIIYRLHEMGMWKLCAFSCEILLDSEPANSAVLQIYANVLSYLGRAEDSHMVMAQIRMKSDLVPVGETPVPRLDFEFLQKLCSPDSQLSFSSASQDVPVIDLLGNGNHKNRQAISPVGKPALVSVIVPCYNQAEYLTAAVESVVAQTYSHWEIIVVNDGSTDPTREAGRQLQARFPAHRIRLVEKENGGLADARNAGLHFAKGEYILPLDADDMIAPTFLEKTVNLLEENSQIAIAYTDWVYFGAMEGRRNAIDWNVQHLCEKENLFTCTSLFRKGAWDGVNGYNTNMTKGVEDWDFWISCAEKGYVGQRIPEALFYYRAKDQSMITEVQPFVPVMFARIILNHPKLYAQELVEKAKVLFDSANLPPPKPSSLGREWLPDQSMRDASSQDTIPAIAPEDWASKISGKRLLLWADVQATHEQLNSLRQLAKVLWKRNAEVHFACSAAALSVFSEDERGFIHEVVAGLQEKSDLDSKDAGTAAHILEEVQADLIVFFDTAPFASQDAKQFAMDGFLPFICCLLGWKSPVGLTDCSNAGDLRKFIDYSCFTVVDSEDVREDLVRTWGIAAPWDVRVLKPAKQGGAQSDDIGRLDDSTFAILELLGRAISQTNQELAIRKMNALVRGGEILALLGGYRESLECPAVLFDGAATELPEFPPAEVGMIQGLVTSWKERPQDEAPLAQLRQLRQSVSSYLVSARDEDAGPLLSGSLGIVYRTLLESGLQDELPTPEEEGVAEFLTGGFDEKGDFSFLRLLAFMLFRRAHRSPALYALDVLPKWFLRDYIG
ncbi:MAG: glycosyltransferase, partial [Phycisphaerae bacterium]